MATSVVNAPARVGMEQRIYLDESGTLGYSGELFTIALVLVNDLPKLETCMLKNRSTQTEVKASQMKTAQKLALARTVLEQNDIQVFFAKLDPTAAQISERKIDKEFLYDAMVAQALAYYLEHREIPTGLPYRISMDMRSGLRESYEDMVGANIGNVLIQRADPLVTALEVRFLDSRYSMGIQAADLFSNIYRIALTQPDSPCQSFLQKYEEEGRLHADFTFGLPQLADQMSQIAAELRTRVATEQTAENSASQVPQPSKPAHAKEDAATHDETATGTSRSSRRRRSRATHREQDSAQQSGDAKAEKAAAEPPTEGAPTASDKPAKRQSQKASASDTAASEETAFTLPQTEPTRRERRKAAGLAGSKHAGEVKAEHSDETKTNRADEVKADHAGETKADHADEVKTQPAESGEPAKPTTEQPAKDAAKTPAKTPTEFSAKAASKTATKSSSKPSGKSTSKSSTRSASKPSGKTSSATSGTSAAKKKTAATKQKATTASQKTVETPPADGESHSA